MSADWYVNFSYQIYILKHVFTELWVWWDLDSYSNISAVKNNKSNAEEPHWNHLVKAAPMRGHNITKMFKIPPYPELCTTNNLLFSVHYSKYKVILISTSRKEGLWRFLHISRRRHIPGWKKTCLT